MAGRESEDSSEGRGETDVPPGDATVETRQLFERFRGGDERAAEELFDRYVERLTALARVRLSRRLAARMDPEDIVLSAYRSFFVGARQGRFTLGQSGDLWRLLVEMTLHKLYRRSAHHLAQRRSVKRKTGPIQERDVLNARLAAGPGADEAAAVADELEQVLRELSEPAGRALELRLQGEAIADIAAQLQRNERTVRRWLSEARQAIARRWPEFADAPPRARAVRPARRAADRRPTPSPVSANPPTGLCEDSRDSDSVHRGEYRDYVLQQLIGSGGAGKIYRALHKPTGKRLAVKFLRKSFCADAAAVQRFLAEAELVQRLRHPHIVPAHGVGRTRRGGWFIVMDLMENGDLAQRMSAGSVAIADARRWTAQAADAIAYAHSQGVIHCDLKPANLLLSPAGEVQVSDFGLARRSRLEALPDLAPAGTPAFMAPEQISAAWGEVSPATDVYGLGAVLYTLLTGRPPFAGSRVPDVLADILTLQPVAPDALRPEIPGDLSALCLRCLAKTPAERIASAAELAQQLRELWEWKEP